MINQGNEANWVKILLSTLSCFDLRETLLQLTLGLICICEAVCGKS